jgi:hypothetical protein
MGNRAVITYRRHPAAPCVYLHWNGGRASVEGFLEAARRLGLRHVGADDAAFFDRFAGLVARHFFGCEVGFTVYRHRLGQADRNNGDNGVFRIDDELQIVGREFAPRVEEVNPGKTRDIVELIVARAPVFNFGPEGRP